MKEADVQGRPIQGTKRRCAPEKWEPMNAPRYSFRDCFSTIQNWRAEHPCSIPSYRGCSYYAGIDSSGTNYKRHGFMWCNPSVRVQPIPTLLVLIPNPRSCFAVRIFSRFGINTAGSNTRVLRAPPVCHHMWPERNPWPWHWPPRWSSQAPGSGVQSE